MHICVTAVFTYDPTLFGKSNGNKTHYGPGFLSQQSDGSLARRWDSVPGWNRKFFLPLSIGPTRIRI